MSMMKEVSQKWARHGMTENHKQVNSRSEGLRKTCMTSSEFKNSLAPLEQI